MGGGGRRRLAYSTRLGPQPCLAAAAVRTPGLASGLGKPATAAAGATEGGKHRPRK